jgi:hypothetical protein
MASFTIQAPLSIGNKGGEVGLETILGFVFQEKCVKPSSLPGTFKKIRMNSVMR